MQNIDARLACIYLRVLDVDLRRRLGGNRMSAAARRVFIVDDVQLDDPTGDLWCHRHDIGAHGRVARPWRSHVRRLAQRIPVRIHIDEVPPGVVLAAGMTATVQID
jgi:hypothetical protein